MGSFIETEAKIGIASMNESLGADTSELTIKAKVLFVRAEGKLTMSKDRFQVKLGLLLIVGGSIDAKFSDTRYDLNVNF